MGKLWEELFCPVKDDLKSKNEMPETEKLCTYEVTSSKLSKLSSKLSNCF